MSEYEKIMEKYVDLSIKVGVLENRVNTMDSSLNRHISESKDIDLSKIENSVLQSTMNSKEILQLIESMKNIEGFFTALLDEMDKRGYKSQSFEKIIEPDTSTQKQ